ncbi:MAG: DUF3617 family protein [Betaproteobacteria bacterium]
MRLAIALALLSLSLDCTAAGADEVRQGMWEIAVSAEAGGQPLSKTPMVTRQCVTQQSVKDLMTQMGGAGACQVSDFQQSAGHASWKIACSGHVQVTGTGSTEIAGDTFNGRMDLAVTIDGQSLPMVQTFTARRVGECE